MISSKSLRLYEEHLHRALHYIDKSLDRDIRLEDMARAACFSSYHFHRIFTAVVGETPADYVRRIRLENAARLLWSAKELSLVDISLKCGFSSPSLFSRNFKNRFGCSPTQWRKRKKPHEQHYNNSEMKIVRNHTAIPGLRNIKLEQTSEIQVAFIRHMKSYNEIGDSFQKLRHWIVAKKIIQKDGCFIGIYLDNPHITSPDKCRYYACYTVGTEVKGSGSVGITTIPAGLYARLDYKGPGSGIDRVYHYFYFTWLPQSGLWPDDKTNHMVFHDKQDRNTGIINISIYIGVRTQ